MKIFKRLVLLNESMKLPSGWWQDTKCLVNWKWTECISGNELTTWILSDVFAFVIDYAVYYCFYNNKFYYCLVAGKKAPS